MRIDKARLFPLLVEELVDKVADPSGVGEYTQYQDDPEGFITEVLGEQLTDDLRELCRSVRDNKVTIAKSSNATGKTFTAARLAVWFFLCFPGAQVYTAAAPPEDNLRRLLWGEINDIYSKHPELFEGVQKSGLTLQKSPLEFVAGVTIPSSGTREERVAKFSGKHAPYLMFLFDEGDAIPDEVYEGTETCMSGGHVRQLIMFNPRAQRGEVYRRERNGTANVVHLSALRHPNVVTGKDVIPGAVTRERTVKRINEWCRRLVADEKPTQDCFELPDYLVGAVSETDITGKFYEPLKPGWYKPMAAIFSYAVLGRYPAMSSSQLISREWIDAAVARWHAHVSKYGEKPPDGVLAVQGIDVAAMGNDHNVTFFRWGGWVERPITWQGVDPDAGAIRSIDLYRRRRVLRACVDGTGVGAGVAPHMARKGCVAYTVMVANAPTEKSDMGEFKILRDQLLWALREWLRTDPSAAIPPDEMLIEEMLAVEYDNSTGKIRVSDKDTLKEILARSPDRLMSLAMTFFKPRQLFEAWDTRGE